jgi:hypothetical protein
MTATSPSDVATAISRIDGEILAIGKRIRRMSDRQVNTGPHVALVKARRGLMAERSALLARQCESSLLN